MTAPAPPWTIAATVERVELDPAGQAETTFTVANNGPIDQRLVLDVVPSENATAVRFAVAEAQRMVPHGGSVSYLVKIAVPPGTPAGVGWFAGRVYSADVAPEESSVLSDRVTFEIKPSKAPTPWWKKWWWLIAIAAALVLVVLAAVLFLVLRDDDPPPPPPGPPVHKSGELVVELGLSELQKTADLDELVVGAPSGNEDVRIASLFGFNVLTPQNGALVARIDPTDNPLQACQNTPLSRERVELADIGVNDVICARTNLRRLSVAVVTAKPRLTSLTLSVTTFE